MPFKKIVLTIATVIAVVVTLTGCNNNKSDVVSHNLSQDADNFQVSRQIVFYNGITNDYVAEVNGRCSLGNNDPAFRLSVVCEVAPGEYIKDYLGLSDNVTYFVLQTKPSESDPYHYEINLRPSTIIPNLNVR